MGSLCGLWVTQNTINIMSLGGMALAIGILVDEATVTIENTHVQMEHTPRIATAILNAAMATAVPRLLALLCILSVFIPAFIMQDPLRSLFMPLTLAVGFAMISSYLLSSTFVPIMSVYLLKHKKEPAEHGAKKRGLFDRFLGGYHAAVDLFVRFRALVVPVYLGACVICLATLGLEVGTELFPQIDQGEFVLRFRPPAGSSYELCREMGVKCLQEIEDEAGTDNIEITMGFVGQVAPNFGIDNMVLFMRGPDDGWLRVKLAEKSGIKLDEFRERLRKVLPERVVPWLAKRLEQGGGSGTGLSHQEAWEQAQKSTFGFEPGDIVSQVMSFGSSTPLAVRVVGTDYDLVRSHAEKIAAEMRKIPYLRDVSFEQTLDYPTVEIDFDRELAGLIGVTAEHLKRALVMATASTRFSNLNYWINDKTGFDYLVQIQVPPLRMETPEDIEELPLESVNPDVPMMVRDVLKDGRVHTSVRPGEYDRDLSQRYLTVAANVEGEDLGRAAQQVRQAVDDAGDPPRGVRTEEMGALPSMTEMFEALGIGLAVAVFVILVLLTAYFQSFRLALISVGAVPGVLTGIVVLLLASKTTINIESFMGSIMCMGVSVSNSVMMVTFMDEHWKKGKPATEAAIMGASERLRPILMTACAMTVGMVPMALALERGSQMEAPLGRAVIGGLVMSTFATLLVLPSIFALVIGTQKARSPSLYPGNPASAHYDPQLGAAGGEEESGNDSADEGEGENV
jgi:multidrug efflux pump subunit AcrB